MQNDIGFCLTIAGMSISRAIIFTLPRSSELKYSFCEWENFVSSSVFHTVILNLYMTVLAVGQTSSTLTVSINWCEWVKSSVK